MRLFRASYIREGRLTGVTFAAEDEEAAVAWAERWEAGTKCPVLTLKREPKSPFTKGWWERRRVA